MDKKRMIFAVTNIFIAVIALIFVLGWLTHANAVDIPVLNRLSAKQLFLFQMVMSAMCIVYGVSCLIHWRRNPVVSPESHVSAEYSIGGEKGSNSDSTDEDEKD